MSELLSFWWAGVIWYFLRGFAPKKRSDFHLCPEWLRCAFVCARNNVLCVVCRGRGGLRVPPTHANLHELSFMMEYYLPFLTSCRGDNTVWAHWSVVTDKAFYKTQLLLSRDTWANVMSYWSDSIRKYIIFAIITEYCIELPLSFSCFLMPSHVMYYGLLLPIGVILLHNIITFSLAIRNLLCSDMSGNSVNKTKREQVSWGSSSDIILLQGVFFRDVF